MSTDTILFRQEGPVAHLQIRNPGRRNAIRQEMWARLPDLCRSIAADPSALVVILSGAEGHFCAGADISEFAEVFATPESTSAYNRLVQAALLALQRLDRPVIAAIEGVCFGGGVSLAMQCDLVFAAEDARFGITPAKLGLVYGEADTTRLVARLGPARAKDLLFSGRSLAAPEALSIGLVDRVVPAAALHAACDAFAQLLSEQSQSSIRTQKSLIDGLLAGTIGSADFLAASDKAAASADFAEGRRAFLLREKPDFPSRR